MKYHSALLPLLLILFLLLLGFSACGKTEPMRVCPDLPPLDGTDTADPLEASPQITPETVTPSPIALPPESTEPSHSTSPSPSTSPARDGFYQTPESTALVKTDSFTANLLQLMPKDKNYMVSPLSLQMALGMLANGAEDETRSQLLSALSIKDLAAFNADAKAKIASYNSYDKLSVRLADSLWINETCAPAAAFLPTFEASMTDCFDADSYRVTSDEAVKRINGWVDEKTEGLIDSILQEGQENFVLALVNALYFKGNWATPFSKAATADGTFTSRDGSEVTLPFMTATRSLKYGSGEGYQLLSLPYAGNRFSMYLLLKDDGVFPADLDSYIDSMSFQRVRCRLPRFQTEFALSANETLKLLGAERIFDPENAQLSGVASGFAGNLFVSDILHKTVIDVDEEGTEAAAVTAVMTMATSARPPMEEPIEFNADVPFFFLIRDDETKTVLFVGEYAFGEKE